MKVVAAQTVFLAKEREVGCVGGRGSPTPSTARSVEKRLQLTLENLDEMVFQEERSILKRRLQKTRTILSFGCTLSTTIKVERMSATQ